MEEQINTIVKRSNGNCTVVDPEGRDVGQIYRIIRHFHHSIVWGVMMIHTHQQEIFESFEVARTYAEKQRDVFDRFWLMKERNL